MADFAIPDIFAEIDSQAKTAGLDPNVMKALLFSENSSDGIPKSGTISSDAISPKGAVGLYQVMPKTQFALKNAGYLPSDYQHNPEDLKSQVQVGIAAAKEMNTRQTNRADPYELSTMWNGSTGSWRNYVSGSLDKIPAETQQFYGKMNTALTVLGAPNVPAIPIQRNAATIQPTGTAPVNTINRAPIPAASFGAPGAGSFADGGTAGAVAAAGSADPTAFANMLSSGMLPSGVNQATINQSIDQINQANDERKAAQAKESAAIIADGIAQGQKVAADYATKIDDANTRQKPITAFNLQQNGVDDEMTKAFNIIHDTNAAAEPLARNIEDKKAVGIFDNPLQWLVNQTQLPGLIGQYNGIVGQQQRAVGTLKQYQGLVANQQFITSGADADSLARQSVADQAATASAATKQLSIAQTQFAGANVLDARQSIFTQMQLQALSDTDMVKRQKIAETMSEDQQADSAQKFLNGIGSQLKVNKESLKLMPPAMRAQLLTSAGASGAPIGDSLPEAIKTMDLFGGNLGAMAAGGSMAPAVWIDDAKKQALKEATANRVTNAAKGMKVSEQMKAFQLDQQEGLEKIQQKYENETTNMDTASPFNPFKIDYVAAAKNPALAGNSVAQYINTFGPQGTTPLVSTVTGNNILSAVAAGVTAGNLTARQAEDQIKQFYSVAGTAQLSAAKPNLFGLKTPVPGYQILDNSNQGFFSGNKQFVNLSTGENLQYTLNKLIANKQAALAAINAGAGEASSANVNRLDF